MLKDLQIFACVTSYSPLDQKHYFRIMYDLEKLEKALSDYRPEAVREPFKKNNFSMQTFETLEVLPG